MRTRVTINGLLACGLLSTMPMSAALIGDTINLSTGTTGTTTLSASPASATVVSPGPEFSFCVGPTFNNCSISGLSGSVNISDTAFTFTFFGSAFATGSFNLTFSAIDQTVTNVVRTSGNLSNGDFNVSSFTGSSITFLGTSNFLYDAVGGRTVVFDVTQTAASAVPEPATYGLIGSALLGLLSLRRFRKKQKR